MVIDESKGEVDFSCKYSLGEYQNARTNNHDYGFGDLLIAQTILALPTYDSKIKYIYLNFKWY